VRRRAGPPQAVRIETQAELRVSVYVRAGDAYAGRPLHYEIVDLAQRAGLRGATAVRGFLGFGSSALDRAGPGLADRREDQPVLVEITDEPTKVRAFLPILDELVASGLVVLTTVTTISKTGLSEDPEYAVAQ
jgi:uncharacterized protein